MSSLSLFSFDTKLIRIGIQFDVDSGILYIRIIDRINFLVDIESIRQSFSRILSVYKEVEQELNVEYMKIIPGFSSEKKKKEKENKRSEAILSRIILFGVSN